MPSRSPLWLLLFVPCACGEDLQAQDTSPATSGQSETAGDTDTPEPSPEMVALERVATDLVAPTAMVTAPDGSLYVLDQPGVAYRLEGGSLEPFLDLRMRIVELDENYDERGLLGMAFAPNYPSDARVFAYYSAPLRDDAPEDYDHTNVLAEFQVTEQGEVDPASARELIVVDWPYMNHNGGTATFGPDGMLYLSMGDGGNENDIGRGHPPLGNGQDWTTLMGSILRIDPAPASDRAYTIPEDNPFVGEHPGADEIWVYGVRNVHAFTFDSETGEMFVADVGQNLMEEVNIAQRGDNLGWNVKEGTLCFNPDDQEQPLASCADEGANGESLVAPILTYTHPDTAVSEMSEFHGTTIIGGRVYRGTAIESLDGAYVFGDWSRTLDSPQGQLLVGRRDGDAWQLDVLPTEGASDGHIGRYVRGFGQDQEGEIYVLTSERGGPSGETGSIWRIVPASS